MTIFNEPLLIASAPDHIVVALSVFFAFAAVSLFCLAVEKGIYRNLQGWGEDMILRFVRQRLRKQRWIRYAFAEEYGLVPAWS